MKVVMHRPRLWLLVSVILLLVAVTACASTKTEKVFYVGGIPDQNVSLLQERFDGLAQYLTKKTGVTVKYIPSVDYAAVVIAFKQGHIQMAWYGGLTGVQARLDAPDAQARLDAPDAQAIAQRPQDQEFHSVFIAQKGLNIQSLTDIRGKTVTFGSESSTSGYLMPLFFLMEAGLDPKKDLATINFSGSHDKTWKLVESGAYQVGALNEVVWQTRVKEGKVDTDKVEVFYTTPPYFDYHWIIRRDVDEKYGKGVVEKIKSALLELDVANGGPEAEIMEAFQADRFIPTTNDNYQAIERVARELGIIRD